MRSRNSIGAIVCFIFVLSLTATLNAQVPTTLGGTYWTLDDGDGPWDPYYTFDFVDDRNVVFRALRPLNGGERWIGKYSTSGRSFTAEFEEYISPKVTNTDYGSTKIDFDVPEATRIRSKLRISGVFGETTSGGVGLWVRTISSDKYSEITGEYDKFSYEKKDAAWFADSGDKWANSGKWELAIKDYRQALAKNPGLTDAYQGLCVVYRKTDNFSEGFKACDKAISMGDNEAYYQRALLNGNRGQFEAAMRDITTHINNKPKYGLAQALLVRAEFYEKANRKDAAITDYKSAYEIMSGDSSYRKDAVAEVLKTLTRLGDTSEADFLTATDAGAAAYRSSNYDVAVTEFTKAFKLKPESTRAITNLINAYRERAKYYCDKKEYAKALPDATKLIELEPTAAGNFNLRGDIYYYQQKYELAMDDYRRAVSMAPNDAQIHYNIGISYKNLKNSEMAIANYTKAINLDPKRAYFFEGRADLYIDAAKYDLAVADYTKAIELKPRNLSSLYNFRGNIYSQRLNRKDLAIADYSKAIELAPNDWSAYANRGIDYANTGNFEAAIADATKAVTLSKNDATALNNRCFVYDKADKPQLAVPDCTEAIRLDPQTAGNYSLMGNAHRKMGNKPLAIQFYRKALAINPKNQRALDGLAALGVTP